MKLLFCYLCQDVQKLSRRLEECQCGSCIGRYLSDELHAEYSGPGEIIGFDNNSLANALRRHQKGDRDDGLGHKFDAFVVPKGALTVEKKVKLRKAAAKGGLNA